MCRKVLSMKRSQMLASMPTLAAGFSGCNYSERKASNEIVAKVEQFKKSTGRRPDRLSEVGIKEMKVAPATARRAAIATWCGTGRLWVSPILMIRGQQNGQRRQGLFVLDE